MNPITEPKMIGLKALMKMIEISLFVPYLVDEKPPGVIIVAGAGTGKSLALTRFKGSRIVTLNDTTAYGVEQTIREMQGIERGVIVVPDMIRILSRRRSCEQFLSLMNIVLEEGLTAVRRWDANFKLAKPLNFGILTAMTTSIWMRYSSLFQSNGFTSRCIGFFFGYEASDIMRVERQISTKNVGDVIHYKVEPPAEFKNDAKIHVTDSAALLIRRLGRLLSNGSNISFRSINLIRTLCKSHAFMRGRSEVSIEDIRLVHSLLPFMNCQNPIATDLDYFVLQGINRTTLLRNYSKEELFDCQNRLAKKQLSFDAVVDFGQDSTQQ